MVGFLGSRCSAQKGVDIPYPKAVPELQACSFKMWWEIPRKITRDG